jgi:hypothetical protein
MNANWQRPRHKNIDELLKDFNGAFHRLRQRGIDDELFDVVSGFEALSREGRFGDWRANFRDVLCSIPLSDLGCIVDEV